MKLGHVDASLAKPDVFAARLVIRTALQIALVFFQNQVGMSPWSAIGQHLPVRPTTHARMRPGKSANVSNQAAAGVACTGWPWL